MTPPFMVDPQMAPMPAPTPLPDQNARPIPEHFDPQQAEQPVERGQWSADQALRIVKHDFERAATFRSTNIEPKWQESSDIYNAVVGGDKVWEGTRIPRANLQYHQAFQQVNALRPQVVDSLCGGDLDFDVEAARQGTTIGQLHMVRSLIQYQLRDLGAETANETFRSIVDRLVEDGLIFGNGVQEWGWDGPRPVEEVVWQVQQYPEFTSVIHPVLGVPVHVPTGRMQKMYGQQTQTRLISRFFCKPVDQVDFYIDPNANSQNVQSADFCIRRRMMTLKDLSDLRDVQGFNIPPDIELLQMAKRRMTSMGDTTKMQMQSNQGINAPSNMDYSRDPRLSRLEVLRYFQKGRHVWVLNREHVIWNGPNQYGQLPFLNWCYINKPGSFYGYSIPELLRSPQRLVKQILDARMDELNLILHPPFKAKVGAFRSASQTRFAPGRVIETTGDIKDVERMDMGNVTQNAYIEVNEAENRAQKVTGVTDLAVLGTPTAGGNSANRTATGVTAQTTASSSRVHGLVAYIEDTYVGPMLNAAWSLIQKFMTPEEVAEILGTQLGELQLDPSQVLNSDPRFNLKTASRMKMRAAMQGGGLNVIMQYMLNPETMGLFADQQGKTLDIEQLSELVCDTYHLSVQSFYRPMTPQEQQAKQQRNNQPAQEKMQLQGARLEAMGAQAHDRDETTLLVALMQALASQGLLNKAVGLQAPIELEAKRLDADIKAQNAPQVA